MSLLAKLAAMGAELSGNEAGLGAARVCCPRKQSQLAARLASRQGRGSVRPPPEHVLGPPFAPTVLGENGMTRILATPLESVNVVFND